MLIIFIAIFIMSCFLLFFSGKWLVDSFTKIAEFLEWKEFVVAFFLSAFAMAAPNFFVGIISALNNVPELSFAEIIGGNVVELALLGGLAGLISKNGLSTQSQIAQKSTFFAIGAAFLPFFLVLDGELSRLDGVLLILVFAMYIFWLFGKKERFKKVYDENPGKIGIKSIFKSLGMVLISVPLLFLASYGIVTATLFFVESFNAPLPLVGILFVGLGCSLPDLAFIFQAAKKGQDWLILGDLMGAVVITATFVLGTVAIICPIKIVDFSPYAIGRIFLIISAIFFLFILRTGSKISKKESVFLLLIYVVFVAVEILNKVW